MRRPYVPEVSTADQRPSHVLPTDPVYYNAAADLIERNLQAGRRDKLAFIDDTRSCTYGELAARVDRWANALVELGVVAEQRVLLCLLDSIDFPTAFLGCIKAGIVPVATNTLLTSKDYEYMLRDSRARVLVVSKDLLPNFLPLLGSLPYLQHAVVAGGDPAGHLDFERLLADAAPDFVTAPTCADDMCFWLYSSGSTGAPKGTVHAHSSLLATADLYARQVLGIEENDVVYSVAKLFFAYGLGNGLTFPMSVGATSVLMSGWANPAAVFALLRKHQPTIYHGVPTLYAAMLAHPELPARGELRMRCCASAGEALPAEVGRRWHEHFGVDILDGLGSTEMLHIFLSNRNGDVRYGTSGKPVPGYELRVVDDEGREVMSGEVGELQIRGPSSAMFYWNNRQKSQSTFQGEWTRSGDKYLIDPDGYYVYAGRGDDMLKVSGIYVSPIEVESALITHPDVLEAAVVGLPDANELIKPVAYVVLKPGRLAAPGKDDELKLHVKSRLAPYKYPRIIHFVDQLPKTATGKIQRYKLRQS